MSYDDALYDDELRSHSEAIKFYEHSDELPVKDRFYAYQYAQSGARAPDSLFGGSGTYANGGQVFL